MHTLATKKLERHKQDHLFRQRICNTNDHVDFCSNDYLDLSKHPKVITAAQNALDQFGVGSTASPMVCGYTKSHQACEAAFADFFNVEKALLFNSGYSANLGILQALGHRSTDVFIDKLCHASLIDGAQLAHATMTRYAHNNTLELKQKLFNSNKKEKYIITDGVFSTSGAIADLAPMIPLAASQDATIIIDDAHGIGILGKGGKGSLEHHNTPWKNNILILCPLGKAFGAMGCIVLGSDSLITYLEQFTRSYLFSTALSPAIAAAALMSLQLIKDESWRREKLHDNIDYFKKTAASYGIQPELSTTAIQSIVVGDPETTIKLQAILKKEGFWVGAFRPPSVAKNASLLRITLHTTQTRKDIQQLLERLAKHL